MKIFDKTVFDTKSFWMALGALLLMTPLQMWSEGTAYAFLVPLAFVSILQGRIEQMVFWLMSSMLLIVGNSFFLPKGPAFYIAQRLLFILLGVYMLAQNVGKRQSPTVSPLLGMMFYVAYMALTAMAGWNPVISYLKLILFSFVYIAYYGVANMAGKSARFNEREVRSIVLAIASYLFFGSLILIPFPAISQLSGEEYAMALASGQNVVSLFKGMVMHSQTLGPVVASMFAFLFADWVVNVRKMNWLYVALLLSGPVLVYKSSSRAGMAALLMAILMGGFCAMKMRGVGVRWRSKVKAWLGFLFVAALAAVLMLPNLRQSVTRFALKYNLEARAGDFTVEEAMSTRQAIIDRQMENFKASPMVGNGFQVSEAQIGLRNATWKELLSAPVEKGVWVTAVLEEGGAIGFVILVGFFLTAGMLMLKRGAYTGLSVLAVLLVSNMAEFTMFSMSAMGGLFWAMVFIGTAMDAARIRRDQMNVYAAPWS